MRKEEEGGGGRGRGGGGPGGAATKTKTPQHNVGNKQKAIGFLAKKRRFETWKCAFLKGCKTRKKYVHEQNRGNPNRLLTHSSGIHLPPPESHSKKKKNSQKNSMASKNKTPLDLLGAI